MARTESENNVTQHLPPETTPAFEQAASAINELAMIEQQAQENALMLAQQIGYDGPLTVGGAEDRIRQGMRRTINECLEMGKTLLILKELTPHGEFEQRVEMLGISKRMAQKFMSATLKFSKTNSNSFLKAANNQTKLLELLVLDDGEIEALENGESARGITLEKIETLTVSELKKALREAEADKAAKDKVIRDKTAELIKKDEQLVRRARVDWPEAFQGYYHQLAAARKQLKVEIGKLELIRQHAMAVEPADEDEEAVLAQARETLAKELIGIHNDALAMIEALGHQFDQTLGLYADERLELVQRAIGAYADDIQ